MSHVWFIFGRINQLSVCTIYVSAIWYSKYLTVYVTHFKIINVLLSYYIIVVVSSSSSSKSNFPLSASLVHHHYHHRRQQHNRHHQPPIYLFELASPCYYPKMHIAPIHRWSVYCLFYMKINEFITLWYKEFCIKFDVKQCLECCLFNIILFQIMKVYFFPWMLGIFPNDVHHLRTLYRSIVYKL